MNEDFYFGELEDDPAKLEEVIEHILTTTPEPELENFFKNVKKFNAYIKALKKQLLPELEKAATAIHTKYPTTKEITAEALLNILFVDSRKTSREAVERLLKQYIKKPSAEVIDFVLHEVNKAHTHFEFFPMLHGKAIDAITKMSGIEPTVNPLNNTASIESEEAILIFDDLLGKLGVSTLKLLSVAIAAFTANNHTGTGKDRRFGETKVAISLKDYATLCGYNVEKRPTDTPEAAEKEALRVKRTLANVRRKVKRDLELLYNISLSWSEKVRGTETDFTDIRILSGKGIRAGYINIEFTASLAEYLIARPLSQYPQALLLLDERNSNAYKIGLKMATHYSNDNNQIKGTSQLLKVKTLLECTYLPSFSEVRAKRKSWDERIKEPFETALDALTDSGLLEDWRYSHSKGAEMTDEEANFKSYEEWENTLLYFVLRDAPNHAPRLAEKKARRGKNKRKKH